MTIPVIRQSLEGSSHRPARGRIVVWGMLCHAPFGGMFWQIAHYLIALRRLGFDVWYVEESDEHLFDTETWELTSNYDINLRRVVTFMNSIGLGDRWVFRPPEQNVCLGVSGLDGLRELYKSADVAINICGAQEQLDRHEEISCRVYLETDPVYMQVEVANGNQNAIDHLSLYDHLFTYGENLGNDDCLVPASRFIWNGTRPPVCTDLWQKTRHRKSNSALTSIANWKHKTKDVTWNGQLWRWSKHYEFMKFIHLPEHSAIPMELAVGAINETDRERLVGTGWRLRSTEELQDPYDYQKYIETSLGEFTAAKEQYVLPKTGWFSDRSVCYLAAGLPVVTQETGFSKFIPTGRGLFSYQTGEEALAAIDAIACDYELQSRAALEICRDYFEADKVVGELLSRVGLL